ncbi:Leukocyte receptor cluster member 9 isoform 2 [Schistosoma japonicum]|uniref:Leukocyte receptor cluster member 9 n=1 Tax=Schistosoma japonicum TaxID=6182 RepID=C1LLC9_SCHJA|nr:A-kinase anchor protein 7 isoform gamma [Schistosoma japonicum]TNN20503.1 Leukocyte receptor cluster member 9 isoform 2 [Schistosoma japonicum]CAX75507.1 Leukocyte receptor cluster member 9 [Schistosoma japonicum]CAX75508.1 Leukocyte receptor cluster member 9 [Schistosoma japonicum]
MRTAGDVVKRVLWDEKIPQECIIVGYLDRFKGILEKPFVDFSWEPFDSLDYFTFGVPEHRIQYFKYKDIIVWDKRFRLDRVFGSSRSTKTIRDVIEKYEKYCITSQDIPDIHFGKMNGNVTFQWDTKTTEDSYSSESQTEGSIIEEIHQEIKRKPNFFICQRIESHVFIEKALRVQSNICETQPYYKDCCIDPKLFHLTLSTVRLEDSSQVSECMQALRQAETILRSFLPTDQLLIKGVSDFHGRVLYAAVEPSKNLNLFVDHLNQILHAAGFCTDSQKKFKPHISLIKITRSVTKQAGTKKINPDLYNEFLNMEFGKFIIDSIHVCAIGKPHDDSGFYRTIGSLCLVNPNAK